ncbi:hypothetical protein [Collinsella aerofaciens]|uniref:Uncharacterized protein n=1 Tax=Collinsella aerofaciens TaxID=74426 RepID=A0A5K1J8E7_9ACTN|nr:hypothetical protein [Collinsella aerofaciens]VWL99715.1 Uncharacterised protein [Collinsella aerofaciens]
MASSDATQRVVLAGLSCGIGLAAPVVMYAATLPFSSVNETVVAGAVPFAVGAVAGVGIYAASLGISEYRAQHAEHLFQPDAMGGAANVNQHQNESQTASMPAQQQWAAPQGVATAAPAVPADAAQPSSVFSGLTGAFQRLHTDDGVPTIARAADAMSEADAWSMIDGMLDDDSPVSCDPARSRDVYQVAIDELTYGGKTGSYNRDDIAAAARAVSGSHAAPAGSTAAFVALVANAANNAAAAQSATYDTAVPVTPAAAVDSYADEPLAVDEETIAARRAAESSLWGAPAQQQAAEAMPYNANLANMPIINDASAAAIDLDDLDEPVISNDMPYVVDAPDSASRSIAVDEPVDATPEEDVPMADYSGHEGMWAAAAAIMDEVVEPAPVAAPVSMPAPQPAAPAYVGRHSAVFPEDTARISREGIERAEAIAAGIMENRRHERVNQILEEEIDRLQSAAVRRTGRAYLSVIEGGTASFEPLRAEA